MCCLKIFFWTKQKTITPPFKLNGRSLTTTFCHEFVRNISAKIAHHWLQSLLLLSNGPELALHRHIENLKKTCINFIPCSTRTISSFCQTIIFFGAISIHCGGHHPVSVMVNTLFLKYISYCCSTSSLGNMPPATTHLKYSDLDNLIGFQYVICQCNITMG